MNMLINATASKTMSSREIAELTKKEHFHVKRDIEKMCLELELDASKFGCIYFDQYNREQVEYRLDEDLTTTLVSGYSAKLRFAVIKRWRELESQVAKPKELTTLEIFQLAVETEKANILLTEKLSIAAPKVDYYDKVVTRENLLNASQVAQKIKMSAVKLNRYLEELGVYNSTVKSSRVFKQWFVDKGFGLVRQTELGYPQAMFTLKGEAWVIERLVSEGAA